MYSPKAILLILVLGYTSGEIVASTFRLPTHLYPEHYELTIQPLIKERTFSGKVDITMKAAAQVSDADSTIELNSFKLFLDNYSAKLMKGNEEVKINMMDQQTENEKLVIAIEKPIEANATYYLHLEFAGEFREEDNGGFLLRSYTENNKTSEYCIANLYPIYARRMFPCFDEPHFKATFNVMASYPEGSMAISTMPYKGSSPPNGVDELGEKILWAQFEETPKMSPSSLALFVSEMKVATNETAKTPVWAPTSEAAQAIFSMPHWDFLFETSQTITLTQYLLPKLDFVFIPDLHAEVLESWGVVYIRSNDLEKRLSLESQDGSVVYNSIKGSEALLVKIAKHIFAQYFGDMVTPDSWTDVWLKEAISQYFGIFLASRYDRTWTFDEYMSGLLRNLVLEEESRTSAELYPILGKEINSSAQLIGSLTHTRALKGASLLYMLLNSFSYPIFSQGLSAFLTAHSLQTGTTDDLIKEWQQLLDSHNITFNDNLTIAAVLQPWLESEGVPVLSVMRRQEPGNLTLMLSQTAYSEKSLPLSTEEEVEDRSNNGPVSTSFDWYIPLTYTCATETDFSTKKADVWLGPHKVRNSTRHTMTIREAGQHDDWVLFDVAAAGLFRVNYDNKNWQLIDSQLKKNLSEIPLLNRIQIIDDSLNLAYKGKVSYSDALPLAEYLEIEKSFYPWHSAYEAFEKLDTRLYENKRLYTPFKAYVTALVEKIYNQLEFSEKPEEEYLNVLLRAETLRWACNYNVSDCRDRAADSLQSYLDGNLTAFRDEYKEAVLCGALVDANGTTWNAVYSLYQKSDKKGGQEAILSALGCTSRTDIINSYFGEINSTNFTPDGAENALRGIYKRKEHTDKALDFVRENALRIGEIYGNGTLLRILNGLGNYVTTENQLEKLLNITSESSIDGTGLNTTVKDTLNWITSSSLEFDLYFYPRNTTTTGPVTNATAGVETTPHPTQKPSSAVRTAGSISFAPIVLIFVSFFK